ncbi:hypothetical protein [Dactylosporangium sp. NPDC005555]|uniref:hypothetical protein n=1 Tax=Dactylosporangium sp. NPDC005555 TaxID=3154889 RepID=UPI0033B91241
MPELSHLYGALARDAAGEPLGSPQAIRRRADRRARTRVLLASAVVAVTVGVTGTAWGVLRHRGADPVVTVEPSQSASAAPSAQAPSAQAPSTRSSTAKAPTSIPATAMLKLPAANRSDIADADRGAVTFGAPCKGALPARTQIVAQRNRDTHFHHVGDPGRSAADIINQNVTIWKAGQAEAFMSQLRAAVTACPSEPDKHGRRSYKLVPLQGVGDEAFRIETTAPRLNPATEEVDGEVTTFDTYIRIGTVTTALMFGGMEGTSTPHESDVQIVTDAAMPPLRTWLTP